MQDQINYTIDPFSLDFTTQTSPNDNACIEANLSSLSSFQECVHDLLLSQIRHMSWMQAVMYTFLYTCISILGIFGNGLVIFVVITKPKMRTTRNLFITNLAISNFLLAAILVPFLWLPTYRIEFPYGSLVCKFVQSFPGTNIYCSALTVSVIAVDRYWAVAKTQFGLIGMKFMQALGIITFIWSFSFLLSLLNLVSFDVKDYNLPVQFIPAQFVDPNGKASGLLLFQRCELLPELCTEGNDPESCLRMYETAVSAIEALFIYVVPMPILITFNCLLTKFLANNDRQHSLLRQRVVPPSHEQLTDMTNRMTPPDGAHQPVSQSVSCIHEGGITGVQSASSFRLERRFASQSASSTREGGTVRRNRTTYLLFAMAFMNALLWLPFILVSLIIQLGPNQLINRFDFELRQLDDAAKLISMLTVCVNPFLYGYLNTNFKSEFKAIYRNWKQRFCKMFADRMDETRPSIIPMIAKFSPASNEREFE